MDFMDFASYISESNIIKYANRFYRFEHDFLKQLDQIWIRHSEVGFQ